MTDSWEDIAAGYGAAIEAGDYEQAEELSTKAIERASSDVHKALSANMRALAWKNSGKSTEIEQLYRQSLDWLEPHLPEQFELFGLTVEALIQFYTERHRFPEAVPFKEREIRLIAEAFGNDHPFVAAAYNDLSELMMKSKRHSEAVAVLQKALAIMGGSQACQPIALLHANLANAYVALGETELAEQHFKEALRLREKEASRAWSLTA